MKSYFFYNRSNNGFTLIELVITLALVGLLASLASPTFGFIVKHRKEQELKSALMEIRSAIDRYKLSVDEGKVTKTADQSGYPPNLQALYQGVLDASDSGGEKKIYFLRKLPRDPFYPDSSVDDVSTWGKRSYESSYNKPVEGKDVYDVFSLSPDTGMNGIPYKKW